jgi:hypothetical protein
MTHDNINPCDPYDFVQVNIKPAHPDNPDATFWMVIRLGSAGVTKIDAHPTREHGTYEEACAEAERFAAKHPTLARGFAVLQAKRLVKADVTIKQTILC